MTIAKLLSSKGLLVDTNLLVLLVIGALNPDQISDHKLTSKYSAVDYRLLKSFVDQFKLVVTTPNILTETSNLLGGYVYRGQQALAVLERIAQFTHEVFYDSLLTMRGHSTSYLKFGLSDSVIHRVAKDNYTILTDDLRLCAYLQGRGLTAINFSNLLTDSLLH